MKKSTFSTLRSRLALGHAMFLLLGGMAMGVSISGCARAADAPTEAKMVDRWTMLQDAYKYDASKSLNAKVESTQMGFGGQTETVTIIGSRGNGVPLYLITPTSAGEASKAPLIVLLHGLGGRIEEMQMVGQYLAMSGFAVVIPEIVGHGQRAETSKPIFTDNPQQTIDGFQESIGDIRRALDYAVENPKIDKNRVGLVGMSLGSIMGSITQSLDERIKTSVLLVGGGDWKTILEKSQIPNAVAMREKIAKDPNALKGFDVIDPKYFAPHIAPRTVFMLNGRKDNIIPEASAKALYDSLRGKFNRQTWTNGGHMLVEGDDQGAMQTQMLSQIAPQIIGWLNTELNPKTIEARAKQTLPALPEDLVPAPAVTAVAVAPQPASTTPETPAVSTEPVTAVAIAPVPKPAAKPAVKKPAAKKPVVKKPATKKSVRR